MDAYLAKPVQPERLRKIVDEMALTSGGQDRRHAQDTSPVQVLDGRALLAQVDGNVRLAREAHAAVSGRLLLAGCRVSGARSPPRTQARCSKLLTLSRAPSPTLRLVALSKQPWHWKCMGKRNDLTGAEGAYLTLKKQVARLERALAAVGTHKSRKNTAKGQQRSAAKRHTKPLTRGSKGSAAGRKAPTQHQARNAKSAKNAKPRKLA